MPLEAPGLPSRFPCWCRAVYSWGGESKRDLGFVEGDLIECLNAGDGSWWMGRLRRDKRMMGLFPSNFVQVLDDSFRPASRASSPMPERSPSTSPFNPQSKEVKPKPSRKPFQSYAAPDLAAMKRAEIQKQDSLRSQRATSPLPPTIHDRIPRVPSPKQVNGYGSRVPSPAPSFNYQQHSRAPSPMPYQTSRAPSPLPYQNSRAPSPMPHQNSRSASPPPPPPPPHRHMHTPRTSNNSYNHNPHTYHTPPRAASPCPPSPGGPTGFTPSPLRDAMQDVMSSLEEMEMSRASESPGAAFEPYSPEAFDQVYVKASRRNGPPRPATSMGIADYDDEEQEQYGHNRPSRRKEQQPPVLSNYVERMETRLRTNQRSSRPSDESLHLNNAPPAVPPKMSSYQNRPNSSMSRHHPEEPRPSHHRSKSAYDVQDQPKLRHRKSAFEVGKSMLGRTFTTKSSSTTASSGVQSTTTNGTSSTRATERSIMSGDSAGAFSATSAGSLARKKDTFGERARSALGMRDENEFRVIPNSIDFDSSRPQTPLTGITYHSSHASNPPRPQSQAGWHGSTTDSTNGLGGLTAPKPKKSGFFRKIIDSARTGTANVRTNIVMGEAARPKSRGVPDGVTAIAGGSGNIHGSNAAREMGLGSAGVDWVQVRRDVNRSNSLSRIERLERRERCQMLDYPAISPVEELYSTAEGDAGADGNPVQEPTNYQTVNLSLVDKNSRFINSLPPMTNPVSLSTGYVCRPYRSDVQRLRAIFTWVSEKIAWEEDFDGEVDSRRVIQSKHGCAEEVAVLVMEMCTAVGIHAEVVRGYLKTPGETPDYGIVPRSNHWWNAVLVDNEWRFMDCSLASPTNPRRSLYSSTGPSQAESWYFLTRPIELCWTHIPEHHQQQHIVPPVAHETLLALPCACPPYFKHGLDMQDFNTSLLRLEDLELAHIRFTVPADVECVAEVEARAYTHDADGDVFESGEVVKKRALAQAEWVGGQKTYTVKALLPGDEGTGILKIYAGKRGLMHSIKDIPHPLALSLPIVHTGENPPYDFLVRHPTPHAQRHDLYVAQPQCQRLQVNNTFVFAVRQHPSSLATPTSNPGGTSPIPFIRPGSAMSNTGSSVSGSASGSNPSTSGTYASKKPAKLAIQAPGGKILRLMRKEERNGGVGTSGGEGGDGGVWETIIKCGERGVWRGLVLADRSARWCVFAEWTCV